MQENNPENKISGDTGGHSKFLITNVYNPVSVVVKTGNGTTVRRGNFRARAAPDQAPGETIR